MNRLVCVYFPGGIGKYRCRSIEASSPYESIDAATGSWKDWSQVPAEFGGVRLSQLVVIHNASGLRRPSQIDIMQEQAEQGRNVIHANGLPNIKVLVAPDKSLLLFDGHHSALAYLRAGRQYLRQVPHMIYSSASFAAVEPEEVAELFPEESREAVATDWKNYTVNWQASPGRQVEERQLLTLGELNVALGDRDKPASKE